jgi:hypothetical protein
VASLASLHGSWMRCAGDEDTREAIVALPGLEAALVGQCRMVSVLHVMTGRVPRVAPSVGLLRQVAWVCSILFRHVPAERVPDFRGLLRLVARGLSLSVYHVRVDSCWALSYVAEHEGGVDLLLETVSRATFGAAVAGRTRAVTIPVCAVRAHGPAGGVLGRSVCSAGQAGFAPVRDHCLGCVLVRRRVCLRPVICIT